MLQISDLHVGLSTGFFKPRVPILHGVNLFVKQGRIFGFLGPNGAGKTTTIKTVLGLIPRYKGQILLNGQPLDNPSQRKLLGYAPENAYFTPYLTPMEILFSLGTLSGMPGSEIKKEAEYWLQRLNLSHVLDQQVKTFSKGMKQRLALCQAMMHKPELIILDEPTTGLDPIGKDVVKKLLLELKAAGTTIMLSSHHLLDVQEICDDLCIIHRGRVLVAGETETLLPDGMNLEQYFVQVVTGCEVNV
ncbi:MAG: ABC transporter ATP-binding protein [Candidatus Cloacimonetes bacterium]|nr:ABC transporter ATP-binding protein [Candidatus Cloacimonadota bacterium]